MSYVSKIIRAALVLVGVGLVIVALGNMGAISGVGRWAGTGFGYATGALLAPTGIGLILIGIRRIKVPNLE